MATAFQQNAFQDDAFQIGGVVPPTPSDGGGGGGRAYGEHDRADFDKKQFIRRALEKAIRNSLEPPVEDEPSKPVKLWTRPQRARVFPNAWKEIQILALLDLSLGEVMQQAAALVAAQKAAYELALIEAEDAEVAALVAQMMVDGDL